MEENLESIKKTIENSSYIDHNDISVKSLEDEMKIELLFLAYKKFSLSELENKLGNSFSLI